MARLFARTARQPHVRRLTHAGRVSHDEATAKAEQEYERFAKQRATLPSPVEKHFEEAVADVKRLERARHAKPKLPKAKRGKKP